MKNVLITDVDNTLFDWFNVWYNSFNAMINTVSKISGIPLSVLKPEIKEIHQKYGTAEYSFVLQELPSLLKKYGNKESILRELDEAIHAYRSERKRCLQLYPTVMDTLSILKNIGVKIIAYTESKEYYTNYRLSKLGLDGVIDVVFSPEDHSLPEGIIKQESYQLKKTLNYHTPKGEIKPNPKILLDIIKFAKANPEQCVYIGDSEMKDIAMAQSAHVSSVFAKYGTTHFSNNLEGYDLLRDVTHWTDADVEYERRIKEENKEIHSQNIALNFSDILNMFTFCAFEEKHDS
ncbi:HAD family hydrolase [Klebsiella pneumoniae]|uniref:HAD family hydrolase n=1 Tax=Klebsiella pneumoniae TaxID=573 RepID=UPI0028C6C3E4|nr:HAD family hydrolase [Klebsiella pneumoniae]